MRVQEVSCPLALIAGKAAAYTFTDNWSPRVGVSIDPWGNRKTKIFANFGRYNEAIPLDMGIRSLSSELDFGDTNWVPPTDGAGHVLLQPDGTIDLSTLEGTGCATAVNPADGCIRSFNTGASIQNAVAFAPGTRMQYLDEYVVGFEHEFGNSGVIFTARYQDRRIKRIVEDMAALSPEAAIAGVAQQFLIGNPGAQQRFDRAEHGDGEGGRDQILDRRPREFRQRERRQPFGDAAEARTDRLDRQAEPPRHQRERGQRNDRPRRNDQPRHLPERVRRERGRE